MYVTILIIIIKINSWDTICFKCKRSDTSQCFTCKLLDKIDNVRWQFEHPHNAKSNYVIYIVEQHTCVNLFLRFKDHAWIFLFANLS